MKVKIKETGEIVNLSIDQSGIDYLLINDEQFTYDATDDIWLADADTVAWWQRYIEASEAESKSVRDRFKKNQ